MSARSSPKFLQWHLEEKSMSSHQALKKGQKQIIPWTLRHVPALEQGTFSSSQGPYTISARQGPALSLAWLLPCAYLLRRHQGTRKTHHFWWPLPEGRNFSALYPWQGWPSGSIFTLSWLSLYHINLSGLSAGKGWQTALSTVSGLDAQGSVEAARVQIHSTHLGSKMSMQRVVSARTNPLFQDVHCHCRSASVEAVPALCHFIHPPPSPKNKLLSPCPCESIGQGSWAWFSATTSTHCGNLSASVQSGLDNHYFCAGLLPSQMLF